MLENQKEKIIKLINASSIFSPGEREEWLQLLDLMNDKQVLELERILNSTMPAVQSGSGPVQNMQLRHIVNLPVANAAESEHAINKYPLSPAVKPVIPKPAFSKFASNLKNILEEKDLPSGNQMPVRTLPVHGTPDPITTAPLIAPQLPKRPITPPQLKVNLPPANLSNKGVVTAAPPQNQIPKVVKQPPVAPMPKSIEDTLTVKFPSKEPPIISKPSVAMPEVIRSGLQNPSILLDAQLLKQRAALAEKESSKNKGFSQSSSSSVQGQSQITPFKIEALSDLSALSPAVLKTADIQVFKQKLKSLISSKGYHETRFNLEKSPLYAGYINTGVEMLKNGKNFETLDSAPNGYYMSQKEFESFTDLLREIQVN
jgi:hypothetical protein